MLLPVVNKLCSTVTALFRAQGEALERPRGRHESERMEKAVEEPL